jgi:predicted O-methyltransferase YrrM
LIPNAELHGVDPWVDYDKYSEYKNTQSTIFRGFLSNLTKCPCKDRIQVHRGLSDEVVPRFADEYFDIVYVDGNHATEYVYRDGCMAFQKTKSGGYIIFDDYDWEMTRDGIKRFISEYDGKLNIVGGLHLNTTENYCQVIVQKL